MMSRAELGALLAGDSEKAAPWVRAAAAMGLVEAQLRLGRMLLQGEGVPRDRAAAFRLFAVAARDGDPDAHNMLGRCHEHGWGTVADPARAAHHYRLAAKMGLAWAQYNLGHLLLDGNGVARDPGEAFYWYRRAADAGHVRAMNLVARCYEKGWGVAADALAARDCYRTSAEGGYFRGAYNYAAVLAGEGCMIGALFWFRCALDGATEPTRTNMLQALSHHKDARLRALASTLPPSAGATEGLI
jgi:hypothetical protein